MRVVVITFNGLYNDEYIKPSSYNPYQENTKILNNDKQQGSVKYFV